MPATALQHPTPRKGREDAGRAARDAQHAIEAIKNAKDVRLAFGQDGEVELPAAALDVLVAALKLFAKGKKASVVPVESELTTQHAADLLMVSRPHLIGLLDAGKIPFRKVGTKRRLLASDVLAYKAKDDERRDACLDELAAEAQRLGLY